MMNKAIKSLGFLTLPDLFRSQLAPCYNPVRQEQDPKEVGPDMYQLLELIF